MDSSFGLFEDQQDCASATLQNASDGTVTVTLLGNATEGRYRINNGSWVGFSPDSFSVPSSEGDEVEVQAFGEIQQIIAGSVPTLSGLSVEDTGSGVGQLDVTTDSDATLHVWIGPVATTPTADDIKAGTGANVSLSQAITLFGGPYDLNLPADALDGDYRVSVVAQDGNGPLSNVLTQSPVAFDTTPVGVVAESKYFKDVSVYTTTDTLSDLPVMGAGNYLVFLANGAGRTPSSVTLEGVAATQVFLRSRDNDFHFAYFVTIPGDGNRTLEANYNTPSGNRYYSIVYIGDGVIDEIKGSYFDWTLSSTKDGKNIYAVLSVCPPDAFDGFANLSVLRAPTSVFTNRTYAEGVADVVGGSPESGGSNWTAWAQPLGIVARITEPS